MPSESSSSLKGLPTASPVPIQAPKSDPSAPNKRVCTKSVVTVSLSFASIAKLFIKDTKCSAFFMKVQICEGWGRLFRVTLRFRGQVIL
jgi:hypothetical protein